ncbi:4-coumarate ligase-like 5 [Fusarium napiforme]|uniref:4-coumarate ligase-like 5 n=1 Tax=Fusarium napiforme TaxID=42672 RepID=A0A8H5NBC5_9HYPO|nr:4-coumarate ligase-like 5 [Fusarium napiforme]
MLFGSQYPDIRCPTGLTVWEWAFEDKRYSPLFKNPPSEIAGFTDATTGERLDFGQVKEHATYASSALVNELGMEVGDTASLFGHNTIWYPVTMFAVLRNGGRVNGASPSYTIGEMVNALKTAGTKYIMTVKSSIKMASAAAKEVGIPSERILLMDGALEGYQSIQQLSEVGRGYDLGRQIPFYSIPTGQTNDVCGYLNFSSGTTGLPKAVMLSHKNIIAQCLQLADVAGPEKKRFLACLPLFHISGLVRFLHWPIASNDECVMLPHFTLENVLEAIVKYRITDLTLVPAIVIRLINDPIIDKYDLTSVKVIACGAAPVGSEVIQRLHDKMPWTGFRQSYGMTESCCCLSTHPPEFYDYKYGNNAGKLLASTVVRIVDVDTGRELGPNETGEILAKGPQIAMGYLNNAKETAETFGADGFLRTGDIGKIDSEGFIHIVDRIKEMIKVKGQQVAPADLEEVLLGHPYVADCAVLGIPDAYSSEKPKAFVVLKNHVRPNAAAGHELMQYVKERRVRYKWVKEVEFVSEIPKGPSGKILRRLLRNTDGKMSGRVVVKDVSSSARL